MTRLDENDLRVGVTTSVVVATVAVGVCTAVAAIILITAVGPPRPQTLERAGQALRLTSKALFLGAGLIVLLRWRITAERDSLYWGTGLVVLGGVGLPLSGLAALIAADDEHSILPPSTAVIVTAAAGVLISRGIKEERGCAEPHHHRLVLVAPTAAIAVAFAILTVIHELAPSFMHSDQIDPTLVRGIALSIAWASLAVAATGSRGSAPRSRELAPILATMAVVEVLRAAGSTHSSVWTASAAALVVAVAVAAGNRAYGQLAEATNATYESLEVATRELHAAQVAVDAAHERQEELEHDARNSLAGLRAALLTLDRHGGELDAMTTGRLRDAALSEVHHLEHLIVNERQEPVVDFELSTVLARVVDARRATGTAIALESVPALLRGRPADLSTALQNVLVNAEEHGSGPVFVTTVPLGDHVAIDIVDGGSGVSPLEEGAIFQRRAKSRTSDGCGLGLSVARGLMRRQGGDVVLGSGQPGWCVFRVLAPVSPISTTGPSAGVPEHHHDSPDGPSGPPTARVVLATPPA